MAELDTTDLPLTRPSGGDGWSCIVKILIGIVLVLIGTVELVYFKKVVAFALKANGDKGGSVVMLWLARAIVVGQAIGIMLMGIGGLVHEMR